MGVESSLGIVLGCVGIVLSLILAVVFLVTFVVMYRKIKRLERAVKRTKKREQDLDYAQIAQTSPSIPTNGPVRTSTLPNDYAYLEEISTNETALTSPVVPTTSDKYTDVAAPLPSFLRNEDMLVTPSHPPQDQSVQATPQRTAENSPKNPRQTSQDYVDPQDAKSFVASMRTSKKLDELAKGKETLERVSSKPVDRVNYSEVVDALSPQDDEARMRNRTSSDAAVILGPPGPKDETYFKKTQSLRRDVSTGPPPSTGRRRNTTHQKEMVTFDPSTAAFKLEKKNSDGASTRSSSSQSSPTADNIKPAAMFLEASNNSHVYAAVDLTAKCRPDDDIIRREGVGTPDHYIACIN